MRAQSGPKSWHWPEPLRILVTELGRWGRSTQDLVQTLDDLHGWEASVLAQTGLSFDLGTASGMLTERHRALGVTLALPIRARSARSAE